MKDDVKVPKGPSDNNTIERAKKKNWAASKQLQFAPDYPILPTAMQMRGQHKKALTPQARF